MSEQQTGQLSALQATAQGNVVRVVVPADVAFSLEKVQTIQKDILGRLGCMACCSGWDIRFDVERSFVVDQQLNVRAAHQIS